MRSHKTRQRWGILVLAVGVLVAGLGCDERQENPYRPKGQLREKWEADGDRIAIVDTSDEIAYKLRRRASGLKVYDRDLTSAGFVRTPARTAGGSDVDSEADATGATGVRVRPVGETDSRQFERQDSGVWAIEGAVRLERTADGWAVFDADGTWLGRFSRSEDGEWRLATDRSDSTAWRVVDEEGFKVLERGDESRYRAPADGISDTTFLALALDGVPVLYRVAIGEWLERKA